MPITSPLPPPQLQEKTVQAMFTAIAHRYDLNNSLLSLGLHHSWKRIAARIAMEGIPSGAAVADVCAGTGDLAVRLTQNGAGLVLALDLNLRMLTLGRQKRSAHSDNVQWVQANAEQLPLPDQSVSAVTVGFGIRNVADRLRAFHEMYRILKPGGRLICLEFSTPPSRWLRRLYDLYSFTLLPIVGAWISGDTTGTYRYLPASIRAFPDQETLKDLLLSVGFKEVTYRNLTGGIVAIHIGTK
jgi:demethylmenaquinone methyltransferase/2-methoxy-6-polyprenyl-1,4-benzoquinol methylase